MTRWEVRPVQPNRRKGRWLLSLIMLGLFAGSFFGGWWWALNQPAGVSETQRALLRQLAEQREELDHLRRRYAWVASSDQVGQQASEQNRQTIKLLEEQIFELQQDLAFYKGVLAPEEREEGLRVRSVEIRPTKQAGRYQYKLMLSRVGDDDQALAGRVNLRLQGTRDGEQASLELGELASPAPELAFRFRHFQAIPSGNAFGELVVPAGFEPASIEVVASVEGSEKPVTRQFDWPIKE